MMDHTDVALGILQTTVVNLSIDKPFPFTPLETLSLTRITISFTFSFTSFSFQFPGCTSMVVFSFPIVMGTLVLLEDSRSDVDDCLVEEFVGSNLL